MLGSITFIKLYTNNLLKKPVNNIIKLLKTEASGKLGEESQTLRKNSYFSYTNFMQFRGSKLGIKGFHILKGKI